MDSDLGRVVDAVPGLVWTAFPDGRMDLLNRRWSEYTGFGVDESRGRGWQAAVHPEDLPRLLAGWRGDAAATAPVEAQVRLRDANGTYRWFLFRAHPSTDASGRTVKWSGLGTDIDDRMQAEEALRARERRFRLIVDDLPVLLSTATPDGELDEANRHYLEYFGASLEELKARETVHGLHPDDRARVLAARKAAIEAGRPYEIECRRRRGDGVYRWFYLRAFPLHDAQGRVALWYRLQVDIEDQKRAEALLAGEKRLLEMVASGRPMSDILEALCRLVESTVSGCYCSIVLLDPDGTKLQEAIAPSLAAEFNNAVRGWPLTRVGGPCVTAARDKVQVIMSDVASDTRWRKGWRALAQKHGLRSCWSTPIVSQAGNVLGTFALYQRDPGSPDALQFDLIEQFTNIASIAIERAQRDAVLRQSEARLAEAERELQLTLDALPALVASYRPDGSRIFVNRTWLDYTGLSAERAIKAERASLAPPEDAARIEEEWRTALAAGIPFESEIRLRRGDGEYLWHTVRRVPARDQTGAIVRWYSVAVDIEERKRAEEALRRSEARRAEAERELQLTIDSIPTLVGTYRPDGSRIFVNRTWRDYTGLTLATAREAERNGFVHPDDAIWVTPEWRKSLATGEPFQAEMRLRRADGEYRWHLVHRIAARDQSGAIVRWYSVGADIEERKRAEEALRESEYESRLLVDSVPGLVAIFTPDGEFEFVNRQIIEYFGRTLDDLKLKRWGARDGIHPEDLPRVTELFKQSIASGKPFDFEVRCRRFDGVYRWFQSRGSPLRDTHGRIVRWYNLLIDIDERKHAEAALRESEARLSEAERESRVTLDTIPVMVWRGAANGYVQQLNERWFEYTGTTPEQVRGRRWKQCVHPDDLERHVQIGTDYVAAGTPIDSEARLRRFDGEYRRFLFRPAPLRDEAGTIVGWYGTIIDIEDRKRAEEKVVEAERELQRTIDHIPVLVATYGPDGSRLYVNQRVLASTDRTTAADRQALQISIHPDDIELAESKWRACVASGEPFELEFRLRMADGTYRWHLNRRIALRDETGKVIRWYGVGYDIEDRKRAEEELRRSEALLAKAQRLSLTGSFSFNPATDEATWSEEVYRIYGYQPGTRATLAMVRARYHPEDVHLFEEEVAQIRSGAADLDYEHRLLMPDGSIKHVHMVAHGSRNDQGSFEYIGAVQDVTQRKRAEEQLRRSEAFLAKAQRLSLTGSFSFYSATQEFIWSEELYRIFEFEPGVRVTLELIGSRYHPEDRHVMEEVAEGMRRGALDFDYEHRLLMADGSIKHIRVVAHGTPDKESTGLEYFGAVQDITQHRHAEAELRRSEAYLAEAQRLSHTGSWVVDYANRKPIHSSEEHHRLFGFDPAAGRPPWRAWMDRIHPEDRPRMRELVERSSREKTDLEMDYRICLPDGTIRYVHDVGHPVLNAAGDVVEFVGTTVDVTQRRLAEDALDKVRSELAHVTRSMSLGALTASIAHEVNQPLAGIITNASTCLRMLAADPPNIAGARMTAQRTIRDGNRAADVITRLRALFSKKAAATESVDLNEATREVLALVFSDLLRNRVFLRAEIDDEHPVHVTGDRVQLQQVILNLVRNATDAMHDVNDRPRHLLVKVEREQEGGARLLVRDAGVGIGPQSIERVFDAFYTTKGDGMGIGLSVSRSIIESHGGKLWAEANDGPGATFSFSIPPPADTATDDRTGGGVWTHQINNGRDAMRNS
jgi:PAS domain S-box-containing protein